MRYWWVNQNQTFRHEVEGGYLWSPKKNSNGRRNPFYEFMREVGPGHLIFSFADTYIRAIGIAASNAYESPKPSEFRNTGAYWSKIGWRVDVNFHTLVNQIRPVDHIQRIAPELPTIYSPLQNNGYGNQGVYLTSVKPRLAELLISLIGEEAITLREMFKTVSYLAKNELLRNTATGLVEWEEHLVEEISNDDTLPETERLTLILARRGQGAFKQAVMKLENRCRITGVDKVEHLRASHIKPWRDCRTSEERLSAANGLLLTPSIDHLFDRGFISFENNGSLLLSPAADEDSLQRVGVRTDVRVDVGTFTEDQKHFLEFHREEVFLEANIHR